MFFLAVFPALWFWVPVLSTPNSVAAASLLPKTLAEFWLEASLYAMVAFNANLSSLSWQSLWLLRVLPLYQCTTSALQKKIDFSRPLPASAPDDFCIVFPASGPGCSKWHHQESSLFLQCYPMARMKSTHLSSFLPQNKLLVYPKHLCCCSVAKPCLVLCPRLQTQ